MTKVTVVMPVRDGEAHVRGAIDSVVAQSLTDWELIVVDDGSRDATPDIIGSYGDPRVRLVQQAAGGISSALNHGIRLAKAPYIARMDADDISRPGRFLAQVAFLDAHPTIGCLGTAFEAMAVDGSHESIRGVPMYDADLRRTLCYQSPFCHGSVMLRRTVLDAVGGYRSAWEPAEDYDLWIRLAGVTQLAALPGVFYRHRGNPEGVSARSRDRQTLLTRRLSAGAVIETPSASPRSSRRAARDLPGVHHRDELLSALVHAQRLGAMRATREGTLHQAGKAWLAVFAADRRPTVAIATGRWATRAIVGRALRTAGVLSIGDDLEGSSDK